MQGLREMRWLWKVPVGMSNLKLLAMLGHEPQTPPDEAVEAAMAGIVCFTAQTDVARRQRLVVAHTQTEISCESRIHV